MTSMESLGVSVRWGDLALRVPDAADILALADVAAEGIYADPDVPYRFDWTQGSPEKVRREVVDYLWRLRGEVDPYSWRLPFAVFENEDVVGIQSVSAEQYPLDRAAWTGSWLGARFQGRGLGTRMRLMVLHLMFESLGAESMHTRAHADNEPSNKVSRRIGYQVKETERAGRGGAFPEVRYSLSREAWGRRPLGNGPPSRPLVQRLFANCSFRSDTRRRERW